MLKWKKQKYYLYCFIVYLENAGKSDQRIIRIISLYNTARLKLIYRIQCFPNIKKNNNNTLGWKKSDTIQNKKIFIILVTSSEHF